ncbi:hypothetical protein AB0945_19675 [Streptomyces sp. NPDC005474]|uniref:hypothetical protein n=1 Tax=Streptomyces sp. NPDC005474 TaxID=3154878 RepID=UPI0034567BEF
MVRVGDVVEETCRVAAETGAAVVHIAGRVSRYAARREDRGCARSRPTTDANYAPTKPR